MDVNICESIEKSKLIPSTYNSQAFQSRCSLNKQIKELIDKKQCPHNGWKDSLIEIFLREISFMDSNNFSHNVGIGERESRIYSDLVARRHFGFGHGIGRSGDLTEVQPKAAGSSLLNNLTNCMVLHIIRVSGIRSTKKSIVTPVATGMSIVLCLLAIRKDNPQAKYVIWPRIDQKSCFKAIIAAGLEPIVIENVRIGDELTTDLKEINRIICNIPSKEIAAVITTTSCFAPRVIDKLEEVAKLCKDYKIPHIINNAYGLQSFKCTHLIEQAARVGRVDAFVQSTDKNFMVPVGGAIIAGFSKEFIQKVSEIYPGRASFSPIVDLFITLLSMGVSGYKQLLQERKEQKKYLEEQLLKTAATFKLKVLNTKNNPISIALTLPTSSKPITELGSMLFLRGVSGTRVLDGNEVKVIDGHTFKGWGTHTNDCATPYLTAAATVGLKKEEVDIFIRRLEKCLSKFTANSEMDESLNAVGVSSLSLKYNGCNSDLELSKINVKNSSITEKIVPCKSTIEETSSIIHGKRWSCVACTHSNKSDEAVCEICFKSKYPSPNTEPLVSVGKQCPLCTLINFNVDECAACGAGLRGAYNI